MLRRAGLLVLVFLALVVPNAVFAEIHAGTDVLGLATSPDTDGEFTLIDPVPGAFDLHLLAYGYQHAQGIVAWECRIELPEGVTADSIEMIGKPEPVVPDAGDLSLRAFPLVPLMPVDGVVHLATLHLTLAGIENPLLFRLAPHSSALIPGSMNFALESSAEIDHLFAWPNDCAECPVFQMLLSAQPVEASTWDGVKSLYR